MICTQVPAAAEIDGASPAFSSPIHRNRAPGSVIRGPYRIAIPDRPVEGWIVPIAQNLARQNPAQRLAQRNEFV